MNKEPLVTITEVAEHFGVSTALIRTWVREGHIPHDSYIKVGSVYRFQLEAISTAMLASKALAQKPKEAAEEAEEEYIGGLLKDEGSDKSGGE